MERIFGVLKHRFRILQLPSEYNMDIQAQIPPALAALYNFIREWDPEEIRVYGDDKLPDFQVYPHPEHVGELAIGPVTSCERVQANKR